MSSWVPSYCELSQHPSQHPRPLLNPTLKWLLFGITEVLHDPVLGLEHSLFWLIANIANLVANYVEYYFGLYPCHPLCTWCQIYGSFSFPSNLPFQHCLSQRLSTLSWGWLPSKLLLLHTLLGFILRPVRTFSFS